jgi:tetratricopeptide (TPR) repeat protein
MSNLGSVLFDRGNLAEAERNYNGAITIQREIGAKSHLAATLASLGDLQLARAKLTEAEQNYREAASIQDGLKEKGSAAASRAGLAEILLEKGQAAQAEASIRAPLEVFRAEKDAENESRARLALVRMLLAQKKLDEAQKEMAAAEALAGNVSSRTLRLSVSIISARVRAAVGGNSNVAAIQTMQKVVADARKAGMKAFELESRLALAEIERAAGKNAAAQTERSAVQKEAAAQGFLLIAQNAAR